jgi:hypothetical protein
VHGSGVLAISRILQTCLSYCYKEAPEIGGVATPLSSHWPDGGQTGVRQESNGAISYAAHI